MTSINESILDEAKRITSGDRRRDYDHPLRNHQRIADLWNAYLKLRKNPESPISPRDAATMMILVKIARAAHTPTRDSFVDIAGYARIISIIEGYEPEESTPTTTHLENGDLAGTPEFAHSSPDPQEAVLPSGRSR